MCLLAAHSLSLTPFAWHWQQDLATCLRAPSKPMQPPKARGSSLALLSSRNKCRPGKNGVRDRSGTGTKMTCIKREIKKRNWAREMCRSSGGEKGAWERPPLSIRTKKVSEMGTGRHFEAVHASAFIMHVEVNLGRSYR